jgi:hypothetical protein
MEQPLNLRAFIAPQPSEPKSTLKQGQYLGFFVPGERVLLKRTDESSAKESPSLVSCSLRWLFEQ